jgi:hypothetical protein
MIQRYKDLRGRLWNEPTVPKWIFRTGNESLENIHPKIANIYNTQLENNPSYELFYFSEEDRAEFIQDLNNFDTEYTYNKFIPITFKCDIFKFALIYKYGGVFMDLTMESLIPLDDIIKDYKEILAKDTDAPDGLCTGFMASVKETSLLQKGIENCVYNAQNNILGENPLYVSGPSMMSKVYKKLYNIDAIPVGKITDDMYIYNMADQIHIYDGGKYDLPIVKIRADDHYSIIYKDKKNTLYYPSLWQNKMVYKDDRFFEIENLYLAILLRKADLEGVCNYYKSNLTIQDIELNIKQSDEYKILHSIYI